MSLKKRIIEISYKNKLSHLGSCLTAVDIIEKIYKIKKPNEKFVLSQGHAGLALYVVLESLYKQTDAEYLLKNCGIHPDRLMEKSYIDCSTGSLGQGLPIALGMALADRKKNVYCLISDGECGEGSIWESLQIARQEKVDNLKIYLNMNGFSGYRTVQQSLLEKKIKAFGFPIDIQYTNVDYLPFLYGLDGHYKVMNEEEYKEALEVIR